MVKLTLFLVKSTFLLGKLSDFNHLPGLEPVAGRRADPADGAAKGGILPGDFTFHGDLIVSYRGFMGIYRGILVIL